MRCVHQNGEVIKWFVPVRNNTLAVDATGVEVTLTYPIGVNYLQHAAPTGTSFVSGTGVWTVGNLRRGEARVLMIEFTVTDNSQPTYTLSGVASADQAEAVALDNTALDVVNNCCVMVTNCVGAGPQGDQGNQGDQGAQGLQGQTGQQGLQGVQGTQGSQGSTGAQGFQGAFGGPQGDQGNQGDQGGQGAQGSTGAQGAQGVQGAQGNQGVQGAQGTQGAQGNQGFTGVHGAQGAQGATGSQGAQGAAGSQGAQGHVGNQGAQGSSGPHGTQGVQGNQGAQGFIGAQGSQGNQGAGYSTLPFVINLFPSDTNITNEANHPIYFVVPQSLNGKTVSRFGGKCHSTSSPGDDIIVTVYKNGISTSMAVTLTDDTHNSTTSNTFTVSTGDLIEFRITDADDNLGTMQGLTVTLEVAV